MEDREVDSSLIQPDNPVIRNYFLRDVVSENENLLDPTVRAVARSDRREIQKLIPEDIDAEGEEILVHDALRSPYPTGTEANMTYSTANADSGRSEYGKMTIKGGGRLCVEELPHEYTPSVLLTDEPQKSRLEGETILVSANDFDYGLNLSTS